MEKKIIQEWKEIAQKWKEMSEKWKRLCEYQEYLLGELDGRFTGLKSNSQVTPEKKKRQNDIGLKIFDGGKQFEDHPPFAD